MSGRAQHAILLFSILINMWLDDMMTVHKQGTHIVNGSILIITNTTTILMIKNSFIN